MNFPYFAVGESGSFWAPTLVLIGLYAVRYVVFAGFAYALGYRRGMADRRQKLQPSMPTAAQLRREIAYSAVAVAVFGLINVVLVVLGALPHTLLYSNSAGHGWMWFVLSIPVALMLHDTYFYWMHRLLHWRLVFGIAHRVHHLSTNPTPWTAYSFHPIESMVQAGAVVLIIFVLPMHPLALIIFQTVSTAVNVYGHCGYELYPPYWSRHWLGRWINTSVAHNTHHATARHNYGLYFLFWDRWMGTLDPDYDRRYANARRRRDRTGAAVDGVMSTSTSTLLRASSEVGLGSTSWARTSRIPIRGMSYRTSDRIAQELPVDDRVYRARISAGCGRRRRRW